MLVTSIARVNERTKRLTKGLLDSKETEWRLSEGKEGRGHQEGKKGLNNHRIGKARWSADNLSGHHHGSAWFGSWIEMAESLGRLACVDVRVTERRREDPMKP
jgi:hypothetical protein